MLSRKGYPKYVLDKCIPEFFNFKFTTKPLLSKKKDPTPKKILIRLPFLGALSVQIRNGLKYFLHKHTDDKASDTSLMLFQRLEKISALKTYNHI